MNKVEIGLPVCHGQNYVNPGRRALHLLQFSWLFIQINGFWAGKARQEEDYA
jgi:hypothetical protein